LTNKDEDILTALFDDILVKDIIVRHGIKDSISIKKLSVFLFNNIGNQSYCHKAKAGIFGLCYKHDNVVVLFS
jgi:uncharacterized protein